MIQTGKIPPQAIEIEKAILGTILIERQAFDIVNDIIGVDCFYTDGHQKIFQCCRELAAKNQMIDLLTVVEQLKKWDWLDNIGGAYYLTTLTTNVTTSAGLENKCRIVQEKYIAREIIRFTAELNGMAYEADALDLLDKAEAGIFEISNRHLNSDYTDLQTGLSKAMKKIEDLKAQDRHVTGVHTGYGTLDRVTHGWQPTDLIVIAARPSVGKTCFALNLARNAAVHPDRPVNVGFFSLEMNTGQLVNRILSRQTEVNLDLLLNGQVDDAQLKYLYRNGVLALQDAKIYIDDTAGITMSQLRSKARRMILKNKVGLIVIDYLQLMSGEKKGGNREQEISQISRELKKMAKDLSVPVIALAQLSREVEKRAGKIPQLSDLRESGAIEQDADVVGFLYRPEDDELKDRGMLMIKKHRNGSLEDISFTVNNSIQKWGEIETEVSNWKPIKVEI